MSDIELNKPYTLFVDKPDGTGFSRDYANETAARAAFNLATGKPTIEHVWLKHYEHSNDAGTVIADWRNERLPTEMTFEFDPKDLLRQFIGKNGTDAMRYIASVLYSMAADSTNGQTQCSAYLQWAKVIENLK